MSIPLSKPFIGNEEKEAIEKVLNSGRLATGEIVAEFESALAKTFQRKYCVAVSSGTAALYLGLKVLGTKRVIMPSITCGAVLHAALHAGASVIFSDVERDTHNLDLSALPEKNLYSADAVIVTHTYGHVADMEEVEHYSKKHDLLLIEDFSQAMGGYFRNRIVGSFGKIAIASFYASKGLTTGHGGAVFTDDEELRLKCLYGRGSRTSSYYEDLIPMNLQMTDIQAAIGLVQLKKMDTMIEMRRSAASAYLGGLHAVPVGTISEKAWTKQVYYKFAIILPENIQKQHFIEKMSEFGIEVGKLYDPPLHKSTFATHITNGKAELPVAESLAPRTVSLPMFAELCELDIQKICRAIKTTVGA